MSQNEIADIKIIKAEVEAIKQHIQIFKGYGKTLDNIETSLIGNSLNGNDGVIHKLTKVCNRLDEMEKFKEKTSNEIVLAKWIFGIVFIAVIGSLVRSQIEDKAKDKATTYKIQ